MVTGARAVTATVVEAVGGFPSLKSREEEYLRDRSVLHDIDAVLARIRAVSDLLMQNLTMAGTGAEAIAPVLASLRLHVEALERLGRLKGVIHLTVQEVDALVGALLPILRRFVPREEFDNVTMEISRAVDGALAVPRGVELVRPASQAV